MTINNNIKTLIYWVRYKEALEHMLLTHSKKRFFNQAKELKYSVEVTVDLEPKDVHNIICELSQVNCIVQYCQSKLNENHLQGFGQIYKSKI